MKKEREPFNDAWLRDPRIDRVLVLEELDFTWDRPELTQLAELWKKGVGVAEIASKFDRDADEVLVALIHLARKDRINARKYGLEGEA